MDILESVLLPIILLLGIITSYQDIKYGKIRNKWIILSLIYVVIVYTFFILFYSVEGNINKQYLIELIANLIFVLIVGFGLWYIGIWTAGDGKLFIAYSMLIPFSFYSLGYQKWIPALTLLVNIFLPASVIMLFVMLFKTKISTTKKVLVDFIGEFFQLKKLLMSAINLFAIYWIVDILLIAINFNNNLFKMGLTLLIFISMQKKLKEKAIVASIGIAILRLIIDKSIYSIDFWIRFIILVLLMKIVTSFLKGNISNLGQEIFTEEIDVKKLKEGMVLSEVIVKKEKMTKEELNELKENKNIKVIKYNGSYYIKKPKSYINFNNFIGEEAEGLTKEQINLIKRIRIKKIKISQGIPFAPFMFSGVLLTIILKGNVVVFLKMLF